MNEGGATTPLRAAAPVALLATGIAAVLYVLVSVGLVGISQLTTMRTTDQQLEQHLRSVQVGTGPPPPPGGLSGPCYVWHVTANGVVTASSGAPHLPSTLRDVRGPTTAPIDGWSYRFAGASSAGGARTVVGESLAFVDQGRASLVTAELLAFVPVMLLVFGASLFVGRASAAPIDEARQRLLRFTADASHELRTPLQIVRVELSLALRRPREQREYEQTLRRIDRETDHMGRLVEDLLWLARFDSEGRGEQREILDLGGLASGTLHRFEPVAAAREQRLALASEGAEPAAIVAPASWLERLVAVLIDNAQRYTPVGGAIRVVVSGGEGAALLRVEDSGPGIPEEERARIFDRFHRASGEPGGSGLGLAIADAIVSATHGRWEVGSSAELGGASFTVRWAEVRRSGEAAGALRTAD